MRTSVWSFSCVVGVCLLAGCDGGSADFPNVDCGDFPARANCVRVASGDAAGLLDAVNALEPNTVVILGSGTYVLDNQVTIRTPQITITGQGMMDTTLAFGTATSQINGIDAVSNGFVVQDLTVLDAPKDGIRVENSVGVTYRRIRATWTNEADSTNGAYGIYPVRCENVLVEDCVAERSSDAGLYVGQCINVIVRNNVVRGNVAGLEIENTQFADVYGNLAENNTAGIVVFDLPGNPVVGRDVRLRDNRILSNNLANFAPGGTVAIIPAGTGTFALASRRVEITGNTYTNNQTGDIAILSGLVVDTDPAVWDLAEADLIGDVSGLGLPAGTMPGTVANFRTENIVVANNTHTDGGLSPDVSREFGLLIRAVFGERPVSSVLYDTIGESMFDPNDASMNSNDNRICAGGNTGGNGVASLDVPRQLVSIGSPILVIDTAPFAPFDCTSLNGGPVAPVTLP
ncbi:MAG: right-handed parallel beta-helix repeat-containing protein [Sandaracinaceae bacterium]|nr:right-handed parallel beta-helix repeat-containing protein [Sandaracinaceae bacterium]